MLEQGQLGKGLGIDLPLFGLLPFYDNRYIIAFHYSTIKRTLLMQATIYEEHFGDSPAPSNYACKSA